MLNDLDYNKSMQKIYKKIWELAKPYYLKGRPMDIDHIEWMMKRVEEVCNFERDIDETILMPLAILHDVGYAMIGNPKSIDHYQKDVRRAHMSEGSKISNEILNIIHYPQEKAKQIVRYVSIHDNWAFGEIEIYTIDKILGIFKDLDYLYIYTKVGFKSIQKVINKNNEEMIFHLFEERTPIFNKKTFSSIYTQQLRKSYLNERVEDNKQSLIDMCKKSKIIKVIQKGAGFSIGLTEKNSDKYSVAYIYLTNARDPEGNHIVNELNSGFSAIYFIKKGSLNFNVYSANKVEKYILKEGKQIFFEAQERFDIKGTGEIMVMHMPAYSKSMYLKVPLLSSR